MLGIIIETRRLRVQREIFVTSSLTNHKDTANGRMLSRLGYSKTIDLILLIFNSDAEFTIRLECNPRQRWRIR
jgi:hypothetical protein